MKFDNYNAVHFLTMATVVTGLGAALFWWLIHHTNLGGRMPDYVQDAFPIILFVVMMLFWAT
ncbi:MAG: hypothetical protein Q7S67_04195, partial [Telluria sp.]|nr:hypothetical protein [Telluria sp.]